MSPSQNRHVAPEAGWIRRSLEAARRRAVAGLPQALIATLAAYAAARTVVSATVDLPAHVGVLAEVAVIVFSGPLLAWWFAALAREMAVGQKNRLLPGRLPPLSAAQPAFARAALVAVVWATFIGLAGAEATVADPTVRSAQAMGTSLSVAGLFLLAENFRLPRAARDRTPPKPVKLDNASRNVLMSLARALHAPAFFIPLGVNCFALLVWPPLMVATSLALFWAACLTDTALSETVRERTIERT